MHLSPKEIDKLMLHNAGFLAQKRYARGLKLNYIETIALLSSQVLEFIRDGNSVMELMEKGKQLLGFSDVMDGVEAMVSEVQVEGTFPDGTKLVTIHSPICREKGNADLVLYGSGLKKLESSSIEPKVLKEFSYESGNGVSEILSLGEAIPLEGKIILNKNRKTLSLTVVNHGDRPVQVGSHYPFFETNPALEFDRVKAFGMRLDIPAGTAVRFEPGESKKVTLVEIAGSKKVFGGNGIIDGDLSEKNKERAVEQMISQGFSHKEAK